MTSINLPKFIAEHYRGGIAARDVVREALTNAVQADATEIAVDLIFSDAQEDFFKGEQRNALEEIRISDNGEGFTDENLGYFDEICTSHKDAIGGKGVGRLSYLKFADLVEIESQVGSTRVSFQYHPEFALDQVKTAFRVGEQETTIRLTEPKEKVNTHVTSLINSVCDDLRLMLFLRNQNGQDVKVTFEHNSTQSFPKTFTLRGSKIAPVNSEPFQIQGVEFECYLFKDDPPRKGVVAMLCADDICVEEFTVSKRFDVCRYTMFVTSPYLNKRSNIERQRIELPKNEEQADLVSPISRKQLLDKIHQHCLDMIDEVGEGEVSEFKESNIKKLRKFYPFININSLGGDASLLDADEIVREYRAQQARNEDKLVNDLSEGRHVSWDDVSHLASEDLARFIVHRALVVDSLSKLPDGSAEDAIHAAILPKGSDGKKLRENNVWLIDDKFLAYSSIFSDQTLKKIIESVNDRFEKRLGKKPDVAAFFTTDAKENPNKLVIIEFKKPGADVFENNKALTQCRLYASDLAENIPSVREVFAFSIVDIDDEFYRDMKQTGFRDVFSMDTRVLYNDFSVGSESEIPLHLYVMPASALIKDAKARNRVFEEVLQFALEG
ncbi:MAG: hypothetical protein CL949_05655 [Erythrobacter sp.]|nr:hypothetical protein [Erythrobacter sp.]|tara:strand:+ start:224 stop:2056 length:1833 start_codon:yes stop_codon:yes gene_type:complete